MQSAARTRLIVLCACLAGIAVLAARRWVWPRVVDLRPLVDGEQLWSDEDGLRWAAWDAPREIGGELPADVDVGGATVSPDGRWIAFAAGVEGMRELFLGAWVGGEVRDPQPISALNSQADECAPAFADGALYFASNRSGGLGGFDLYRAPWDGVAFATGAELVPLVNSAADELDPQFAQQKLLFASNRAHEGRTDFELYEATFGVEGRVERIASASSTLDERDPCATAERSALWFARVDPASGASSLWRSTGWRGAWLVADPARGLGRRRIERAPEPSSDGLTVRFASVGEDLRTTLWEVRTIELLRGPDPERGWADLVTMALLALVALLAGLSQRWNALDTLYKCALGSLLLHLLLLLLLRFVYPEGDAWTTQKSQPQRYRVHVEAPTLVARANAERGGSVEVARRETPTAPAPVREDVARERSAESISSLPVGRLDRSELEGVASAPERRVEPTIERALDATDAVVELEAPRETVERRSASTSDSDAPIANATGGQAARRAPRVETTGPSALAAPRSSADLGASIAAPSSSPLGRRVEPTVDTAPARDDAASGSLARAASRPEADRGPSIDLPKEERVERSATSEAPAGEYAPSKFTAGAYRGSAPSQQPERVALPSALGGAAPSIAAPEALTDIARRTGDSPSGAPAPRDSSPVQATEARRSDSSPGPALAAPAERGARRSLESSQPLESSALAAAALALRRREAEGPTGPARDETSRPSKQLSADHAAPAPLESIALAPAPPSSSTPDRAPPRLEDTPYRSRFGEEKQVALREFGGDAQTERAVATGLGYLARLQNRDGSWGRESDRTEKYRDVRVGKTGLALLAFLGAGHTPGGATEHARVAERAVNWLLAQQSRRNGHFGDGEAYGHGIATYALAECYALTRDARLRPAVSAAVDRILAEQVDSDDPRLAGGWSYYYADDAQFDRWPRASITVWQVMALESARLGGIDVPDLAFDAAREFLIGTWDEAMGRFRYNHDPRRLNSAYRTLPGSTPAALFALSLLGEPLESERWSTAVDFLGACAPRGYRFESESAFVERAQGNLYFWYYGSLALLRRGGAPWARWNTALKDALLPAQSDDGSWRPIDVYSEYAGDSDERRIYSTAMCVLSLEVYYRYFTPLLRVR